MVAVLPYEKHDFYIFLQNYLYKIKRSFNTARCLCWGLWLCQDLPGFHSIDNKFHSSLCHIPVLNAKHTLRDIEILGWCPAGTLKILVGVPQDFEILGWCPAELVLPHGAKVPLIVVGHPSSDGITRKMPYGVDFLHRRASHPIFSYWVG